MCRNWQQLLSLSALVVAVTSKDSIKAVVVEIATMVVVAVAVVVVVGGGGAEAAAAAAAVVIRSRCRDGGSRLQVATIANSCN